MNMNNIIEEQQPIYFYRVRGIYRYEHGGSDITLGRFKNESTAIRYADMKRDRYKYAYDVKVVPYKVPTRFKLQHKDILGDTEVYFYINDDYEALMKELETINLYFLDRSVDIYELKNIVYIPTRDGISSTGCIYDSVKVNSDNNIKLYGRMYKKPLIVIRYSARFNGYQHIIRERRDTIIHEYLHLEEWLTGKKRPHKEIFMAAKNLVDEIFKN